jgi:toxin FitB
VIILDTNVVSEMMRVESDRRVMQWLDGQPTDELWLTAINSAELMFGILRLPEGERKRQLANALTQTLDEDFSGRILPFDAEAAELFANIAAKREAQGRIGSLADTQIAAICLVRGATLATRNVRHFDDIGLSIINPWL